MREDIFPENQDDDLQWTHLIDDCRRAIKNGTLEELVISEEEFEYLLEYFAEEAEDEIVAALARYACEKHPYSTEIILRYSDVLIAQNKPKKAIEILSSKFSLDPGNGDICFLLGRGEVKMGNWQKASDYIQKALALNPEASADMLSTVGEDLVEMEEYQLALEYFDKALEFDKEEITLYDDIAFCLEKLKRTEESINYYQRYLDQDPFSDYVWFNVGTLYAKEKNFDKAMEAFEYAITLNPTNSSAIYNKAIVYVDTGRYELGINTFKELLKYEPENIYALITIASASLKLDDYESASIYYRMALNLDPEDIDSNTGMAYICMLMDDYFNALIYLRLIADSAEVDYSMIHEQILVAFKKTGLPEYLVYYLVSQFYLNQTENFGVYAELLFQTDELWINKLYSLLPNLKNDSAIAKKLQKRKTR